jgi:hypothetical protein
MLINRLNPPPKFAHVERVAHRICLIADQLNVVFDVPFKIIDAVDRGVKGGFILSMTRMLL